MKRTFAFVLIPFIIGIIFAYKINLNLSILIALVLLFTMLCTVFIIMQKGFSFALFMLFLIIGSVFYIFSTASTLDDFNDKSLVAECKVINIVNNNENYSTYKVNLSKINNGLDTYIIDENIILRIYEGQALELGEVVKVKGSLGKPAVNTNPGLFNYRLYLQTQDIFYTMTVNGYAVNVLRESQLTNAQRLSNTFKNHVIQTLDKNLSSKSSNLMKSIILGDDSFLDEYTQSKFRTLGIAHILAVSGLHIGLIFAFITFIFKLLKLDKKISIILTIFLIWLYAFFIGFPSSVLRASVMFSVLALSTITYRRYDSLNSIAFSALLLLMYRPSFLFSMGFQFSFIATASLIIFYNKLNKLLFERKSKITNTFSSLIAIQIGMLPSTVYYFNNYCIFSILSNLLIIPLLSLSLTLSLILLIVPTISLKLANVVGLIIDILIHISDFITEIIYSIPILNITLRSMSVTEMIMYFLIVIILLRFVELDFLEPRLIKSAFIFLSVVILINMPIIFLNKYLSVDFIDVGQGDCSIIRSNSRNILIDSGGSPLSDFDIGSNTVLPYLRKHGVKKLDAVFISHFHEDHCEGLTSLIGNIKIDNIFIGYRPLDNKLYDSIKNLADNYDIPIITLSNNDIIELNKDVNIKALNSINRNENVKEKNENNLSLVLLLEAYGKKILFTGDIEKEAEIALLNEASRIDINVLKVPHHGSKTSSTQDLISFYEPEYAIIQVGKNTFGHPSREIIERYEANGIKIYRNDIGGMISVRFNQDILDIISYVQEKMTLHDIIVKYRIEVIYYDLIMLIFYFILKKNEEYFDNQMFYQTTHFYNEVTK